jgi:hypothetical protein
MNTSWKNKTFYLFLSVICLVSITGAAVYYDYALDWLGVTITLLLSALGVWLFARPLFAQKKESFGAEDVAQKFIVKKDRIGWKKIALTSARITPYLFFLLFTFYFLLKARTDAALTSPWQVVSYKFFIIYFLATGYLFFLILKKSHFIGWLIVAHYFLSFSLLWIVFKIGYGYDPFIHQATVQLIDKQGAIFPKTPYYLGQYSLILLAHKIFFIPIVWADKLLVPFLAALTLPPAIYLFLTRTLGSNLTHPVFARGESAPLQRGIFQISNFKFQISLLFLLILPFSVFTLTVPQTLAYLFLLLSIMFSLFAKEKTEIILSFLLSLAALAIHPVAGIPALLFALAMFVHRRLYPKAIKKIFYSVICLLAAGVLPFLFYLTGQNSAAAAPDESSSAGFIIPSVVFPRRENIWLNFIYFFVSNEWLIIVLLSLGAVYATFLWRKKIPQFIFLDGFALSLLAAYFLTLKLNFGFLIDYERADYAQRILFGAFIFFIPVLAVLAAKTAELILSKRPAIKYPWLIFLALLICVSLYGSYPRRDNFYNSHSFSVGAGDLAAVRWIDQNASGSPYVVLADQQVSVAALWTFGFSHYFNKIPSREGCRSEAEVGCVNAGKSNEQIYFYPIPTGGPLYQIYLDMVYQKPNRATAMKATDLTGANTVYFVINKYWTDFDKIVEQAKIDDSSFQNINNGQIYIFKFNK